MFLQAKIPAGNDKLIMKYNPQNVWNLILLKLKDLSTRGSGTIVGALLNLANI